MWLCSLFVFVVALFINKPCSDDRSSQSVKNAQVGVRVKRDNPKQMKRVIKNDKLMSKMRLIYAFLPARRSVARTNMVCWWSLSRSGHFFRNRRQVNSSLASAIHTHGFLAGALILPFFYSPKSHSPELSTVVLTVDNSRE